MSQGLDPPGMGPLEGRGGLDLRGWRHGGRGLGVPTVAFKTAEHLVGQSDGTQGLVAADARTRFAAGRRHEVLQLQGQRLVGRARDLVDPQDLAEEMVLDRRGLAQVNAVEIEPAARELLRGADQRGMLGGEVKRGVSFRAQIRILRTAV